MSRHATDWAWETDPGSSSLKLILLSMADRADEYNLCYQSVKLMRFWKQKPAWCNACY